MDKGNKHGNKNEGAHADDDKDEDSGVGGGEVDGPAAEEEIPHKLGVKEGIRVKGGLYKGAAQHGENGIAEGVDGAVAAFFVTGFAGSGGEETQNNHKGRNNHVQVDLDET